MTGVDWQGLTSAGLIRLSHIQLSRVSQGRRPGPGPRQAGRVEEEEGHSSHLTPLELMIKRKTISHRPPPHNSLGKKIIFKTKCTS